MDILNEESKLAGNNKHVFICNICYFKSKVNTMKYNRKYQHGSIGQTLFILCEVIAKNSSIKYIETNTTMRQEMINHFRKIYHRKINVIFDNIQFGCNQYDIVEVDESHF